MNAPPRGSRRRRGVHPLAWILGLPLALVLIAWGAVSILLPPAKVRTLVQAQLAGALARDVRYDEARVSLWPPVRLTVTGVALAEPGGFDEGAALSARSIHLDLDVFALLGNKLVVRRLVIDQPQVHLVLRPDGTTNFDHVSREQPPGSGGARRPLDLEVRELRVDGGHVLVDDLKARRRIAFALATRVALSAESGGARFATRGETHVRELAFGPATAAKLTDLNTSLSKLDWKLEHRGKFDATRRRLALEKLAIAFGGTGIGVSGLIDQPGPEATLDRVARASGVDQAQIMGFLAAADAPALKGIRATGRLDFDLAIQGRVPPRGLAAVTGVMKVADASFRYPGAAAGVERLSFRADFAPDSIGIADLRAVVTGKGAAQPIAARLEVTRFADPQVRFALRGDADLAAVGPMFAPKDTRLGGRVALDVQGHGRTRDPAHMALEGHAELSNVSVEGPGLPNKVESVNGAITFSTDRAGLKALTAKAGRSSFTLDGTVTRPLAMMAKPNSVPPSEVDFTLTSPYLDLAELLPATPGAPLAPNAHGGGHVRIGRLRSQRLDVTNVDARITLEPGVVVVPDFTLNGYDGRVGGDARFDLNDPARPVFAMRAKVDSVDADALLSAWTPLKGLLKGRLGTTLDLSGEGQTPELLARTLTAQGLAAFANGTVGPAPALEAIADAIGVPGVRITKVQDLKLPFSVQRGRVVCSDAVMRTSVGDWRFSGSSGFDGSLDYAMSGTVPKSLVSGSDLRAALAAGGLTDANGDVLLDLRLGGTTRAPHVTLDSKSMQARVQGRLSEALTEQKRRLQQQLGPGIVTPLTTSGTDSAGRAQATRNAQALIDSLRKQKGSDIFKSFFGGGRKDTTRK